MSDSQSAIAAGPATGPVRRRLVRTTAAALVAVSTLFTAACVGLPSSGVARPKPLSQSHNNVFIVAREPSADLSAEQTAKFFLQALTGDQKDPSFSVAQDYLTDDVRKTWIQPGKTFDAPTQIVDDRNLEWSQQTGGADHDNRPAAAQDGSASAPVGTVTTVSATASELAELDTHGFYRSLPQPRELRFDFTLKRQSDGWRIQTPPKERPITMESFKRVYQTNQSALPVYLPGPGVQQMDQVYLTQATGKVDYTYNALADAVLNGRDAGERSAVQLAQPVQVTPDGVAVVKLTVPPGSQDDVDDVTHALRATFNDAAASQQLVGATPTLSAVQIDYGGCTACTAQPLSTVSQFPRPVYWICPLPNNSPDSAVVTKVPGTPANSPVCGAGPKPAIDMSGIRIARDQPIAVRESGDPSQTREPTTITVAVVTQDGKDGKSGSVVVVDQKNPADRQRWFSTSDVSLVTDLEWDPVDGSLWIVENHNLYRVQAPGEKGQGQSSADPVAVPNGAGLTGFKPSPDGTRAVVVTGQNTTGGAASSPWPAAMVRIDRGAGAPRPVADGAFALLSGQTKDVTQSTTLATATDAAWVDGRTVVLMGVAEGSVTPKLFKVYSDGSQDSVISDPDDAQPGARHIAAASGVTNGRTVPWVFSDGAGTNGAASNVYFKGRGGAESYQENGSSPVVPTFVGD